MSPDFLKIRQSRYLSQCAASWRSPSWTDPGQRWLWNPVWLSGWWTGILAAACGHKGASAAEPGSSRVGGADLPAATENGPGSVMKSGCWAPHLGLLSALPGRSLWYRWKTGTLMVFAEGSTPEEAVSLSLITRPLLDGGLGGVERARLDCDFKPVGHMELRNRCFLYILFTMSHFKLP